MSSEVALNRYLALVLWAKDKRGEDDVAVFPGKLIQRNGLYALERASGVSPEIRDEWLPRIEAVPEDLRETLAVSSSSGQFDSFFTPRASKA